MYPASWTIPSNGTGSDEAPPLPSGSGELSLGTLVRLLTAGLPDEPANLLTILAPSGGWGSVNLTYSFATSVPSYYSALASERNEFTPLTPTQQAAVRSALDAYSAVTMLRFVEDTNPADGVGDLVFGAAQLPSGVAAWGYLPGSSPIAGDVWLDRDAEGNADPTKGSSGFTRLLHEIGHAVGLKHSGNYDTAGGEVDGPFLSDDFDTRQYTVMSYNPHPAYPSTRPDSLMMLDVAALQQLYGANMSTATGNTTYRWDPLQPTLKTIWDAGGIDTFDASNHSAGVVIDLRPGHFSSVGVTDTGGGGIKNIGIALGTVIERGQGGSGSDLIIGNDAANQLAGVAGADTIQGGAGNDTILGGSGFDVAVFAGASGDYRYRVEADWLVITGPDGVDRLSSIEQIVFDDLSTKPPVYSDQPSLRLLDAKVTEGAAEKALLAQVVLDRPAEKAVTVTWTTWGLTAAKGKDYVGQEGTLTIPIGGTAAAVRVRIVGDDISESTETMELRFSNLQNATFLAEDKALLITIEDDDRSLIGQVIGALGDVDDALPAHFRRPPSETGDDVAGMGSSNPDDGLDSLRWPSVDAFWPA